VHALEHDGSAGVAERPNAASAPATRERLAASVTLPALIVAALTAAGAAIRLVVAHQSVFADELSTYYIVSTNGFTGVISTVHGNGEISPPLYFILSWLTTRIDLTPELLRAPSLLVGAAAIPLTYLLGLRTVGRSAALVGAALTTLSPFMIFYSTEARGYGLMLVLVMCSTLAMLAAVEAGRARWWIAYAASSCAAVYTHYPAVFALGAQLLWLLWAHPQARKAALLANAGAVIGFLPWLSGLINDINSPTTAILNALEPFNLHTARLSLEHWSVGYPLGTANAGLRDLPGVPALILLALGIAAAVGSIAVAWLRGRARSRPVRIDRRLVLIVALALAAPVGEAIFSLLGTDVFGTGHLATSWPAFALCLAALLVAAGPRLRFAAVALVIASFAIGAARMLEDRFQRPDYDAAASLIDREAAPGDVVVDATGLSPAPITNMDVALHQPHHLIHYVGALRTRYEPTFRFVPAPPPRTVARRAEAAAGTHRVYVVSSETPAVGVSANGSTLGQQVIGALSPGYRPVETRTYPGIVGVKVSVFAKQASPPG
jgi:4-amino-4-deoxy-L-arabinose transferase-like glycosyltransferase